MNNNEKNYDMKMKLLYIIGAMGMFISDLVVAMMTIFLRRIWMEIGMF